MDVQAEPPAPECGGGGEHFAIGFAAVGEKVDPAQPVIRTKGGGEGQRPGDVAARLFRTQGDQFVGGGDAAFEGDFPGGGSENHEPHPVASGQFAESVGGFFHGGVVHACGDIDHRDERAGGFRCAVKRPGERQDQET